MNFSSLKKMIEEIEKKKEPTRNDYKEVYNKVKDILENDIFENCYIFEYIKLSHSIGKADDNFEDSSKFANYIKRAKYKKIVKFNLESYNPKKTTEEKMEYILNEANNCGRLKFYFNNEINAKNPNKHLYSIVDVGGYEDLYYSCDEEGEENGMIIFNDIIPISLTPFEM